jgi:L-threonylcarbamoyladenylate synthase
MRRVSGQRSIESGLVIGIPTDTVYGLACADDNEGARQRIYEMKGRPPDLQLPVLVADIEHAGAIAELTTTARQLAEAFWPGPLTIVVPRPNTSATVGVRAPANDIVLELCAAAGPLASTSANRHGQPPHTTAVAVREDFGDEVAEVVDGGVCDQPPSTVVDCTGGEMRLLRAGSISWEELCRALRQS